MNEKYLKSLLKEFIHVDYTSEASIGSVAADHGKTCWEEGTFTSYTLEKVRNDFGEDKEVFVLELIDGTELTRIPSNEIQKIYVTEKKGEQE